MKAQYSKYLKKSIWVVLVVFVIRCFISYKTLTTSFSAYDLFSFAGEAIGIGIAIMFAYEKWLWRYNPLEKMPKLHSSYVGIIKSSYDNLEREATLKINQSLLSIHITLFTKESRSQSVTATVYEINEEWKLVYTYMNNPKIEFRDKSEIHYGTAIFNIDSPDILEGVFFTDSNTIIYSITKGGSHNG